MFKKLVLLFALLCALTPLHAQDSSFRRQLVGMGIFAQRPPCGSSIDMFLAVDTQAIYVCYLGTWTAVSGGGGGGSSFGLDCTPYIGADLGITLNACIAALPATGGIANASTLTPVQTLSTPVSTTKPVDIYFCGQQISQTASVTLSSSAYGTLGGSLTGCPEQETVFTKAGNLAAQVILDAWSPSVEYMRFVGTGFTGAAVELTLNSGLVNLSHNYTNGENVCVVDLGTAWLHDVDNQCYGWGVSAYQVQGNANFENDLFYGVDAPATFTPVSATGPAIDVTTTGQANLHFVAILNFGTSTDTISAGGLILDVEQSALEGVLGGSVISVGSTSTAYIVNSGLYGGDGSNPTIKQVGSNYFHLVHNIIQNLSAVANAIEVTGGSVTVADNDILFWPSTSGTAAIKLTYPSSLAIIKDNRIAFSTSETPSGLNYAIWLAGDGTSTVQDTLVDGNMVFGNATQGATHDIGVHYTNSSGLTGSNDNLVKNTHCIQTDICIDSAPTSGETNYYHDNFTASGTLYNGIGAGEIISGELSVLNCGTAVGCSNTFVPNGRVEFGSVPLTSGTPSTAVITGLKFNGSTTYFCVGTNATTATNNLIKFANSSGSSTTITGPNTSTNVINYVCVGN